MPKKITDRERLDFLQRQRWTRWVGYDTANGYCIWPVFAGGDLRAEIDEAIRHAVEHESERNRS